MYEKENNTKSITQSVLSEQLPSAEMQLLTVLGLCLWKVRTEIHLQAEELYSRSPFPPWASKASVK